MGARDIWPFASEHGGHARIVNLPIGANTSRAAAGTSWLEGEVVEITAASGDIDVTPDGAADPHTGLVFIAASRSEGEIVKAAGLAGTTGNADGRLAPCYVIESGVEFASRNVFDGGTDTNIGPAGNGAMTNITVGATVDLWRDNTNPGPVSGAVNGDFGFDDGGDGMVITRILDSQGRDTSVSGDTADLVVAMLIEG